MVQFCAVADVAAFLQVTIAAGDPTTRATAAIEEASAAIQNYTRQTLSQVNNDALTLTVPANRRTILLPELPVTAVASVVEDGTALTVGDHYTWTAEGILARVGRDWDSRWQKVVVTHTHGYATIPDDIKHVCVRAAARRYQAGLRAAETAGVAGIQSSAIPDDTTVYTPETGPNNSMLLGASAAIILLPSEQRILDRYRVKP